jgi:hypothetical protein
MRPFLFRTRALLALIVESLRKLFAKESDGFGSQRMCPFCGLITPRAKQSCLECGKSLRGIQVERKDAKQW